MPSKSVPTFTMKDIARNLNNGIMLLLHVKALCKIMGHTNATIFPYNVYYVLLSIFSVLTQPFFN